MGIFSQDKTTTNQVSQNQQQGISNRDVTGQQFTISGGSGGAVNAFGSGVSVGGGGSSAVVNQNLDASALATAASLVNNALNANTTLAQNTIQGFQNATQISSEQPNAPNSGFVPSNLFTPTGATPIVGPFSQHDLILFGGIAVVGILLIVGYMRYK